MDLQGLVYLLGAAVVLFGLMFILVAVCATRTVVRSNKDLARRYEALRHEALSQFVALQREQNDQFITDTRVTISKMNAMADGLWAGLSGTVRDRRDAGDRV